MALVGALVVSPAEAQRATGGLGSWAIPGTEHPLKSGTHTAGAITTTASISATGSLPDGATADTGYFLPRAAGEGDDFRVCLNVVSTAGVSGVMLRDSLAPDAAFVFVGTDGTNTILRYRHRSGEAAQTIDIAATGSKKWFRLVVGTNTVYAYDAAVSTLATPGTWNSLGAVEVDLGGGSAGQRRDDFGGVFVSTGTTTFSDLFHCEHLFWSERTTHASAANSTGTWTPPQQSSGPVKVAPELLVRTGGGTPGRVDFPIQVKSAGSYRFFLHLPAGSPASLSGSLVIGLQETPWTPPINAVPQNRSSWVHVASASLPANGTATVRLSHPGTAELTIIADAARAVLVPAVEAGTTSYPGWLKTPSGTNRVAVGGNNGDTANNSSNYVERTHIDDNGTWIAGAYSNATVLMGDGRLRFRFVGQALRMQMGLTATLPSSSHPNDIQYRFYNKKLANGAARVQALGGDSDEFGYVNGDWLEIERVAGLVVFRRNSTFLHAIHMAANAPLHLYPDVSFLDEDARVLGTKIVGFRSHENFRHDLDLDGSNDTDQRWVIDADPEDDIQSIFDDGASMTADPDGDDLDNAFEQTLGTNPTKADTDGDGLSDSWEHEHALNPLNPLDAAYDLNYNGLTVTQEHQLGLDPRPQWREVAIAGGLSGLPSFDGTLPNGLVDSFDALGRLLRLETDGPAGLVRYNRWRPEGGASQTGSLGPVASYTKAEVRQNVFGEVAASVHTGSGSQEIWEIRVADAAGAAQRLGQGEDWRYVRDLRLTGSGYVFALVKTAAGQSFLLRWRRGTVEKVFLPSGTLFNEDGYSPRILGVDEYGGLVVRTVTTAYQARFLRLASLGTTWTDLPAASASLGLGPQGLLPGETPAGEVAAMHPYSVGTPVTAPGPNQMTVPLPVLAVNRRGDWSYLGSQPSFQGDPIHRGNNSHGIFASGGKAWGVTRDSVLSLLSASTMASYSTTPAWYSFGSDLNRHGDSVGGIVLPGNYDPILPMKLEALGSAFLLQRGRADFSRVVSNRLQFNHPQSTTPKLAQHVRYWRISDGGHLLKSTAAVTTYPSSPYQGKFYIAVSVPVQWSVLAPDTEAGSPSPNGLADDWEFLHFGSTGQNPEGDPDGDDLTNLQEFALGTIPVLDDTDDDGISDYWEFRVGFDPYAHPTRDGDVDGIPDLWELQHGYDPTDPGDALTDADGDGRTLLDEYLAGTDPGNHYDGFTPVLELLSGDAQTGPPGGILAVELLVRVRNPSGVVMANAPVAFAVQAGSGKLVVEGANGGLVRADSLDLWTDSTGVARVRLGRPTFVRYESPVSANVASVVVASAGGASVSFHSTTTTALSSGVGLELDLLSGNGQSGAPGSLAASPMRVRVADAGGTPVMNVPVNFSVTGSRPSGNGLLTVAGSSGSVFQPILTLHTDAMGVASMHEGYVRALRFQHPATAGTSTVTASVGSADPVSFQFQTDPNAPEGSFGEIGGFEVLTPLQ